MMTSMARKLATVVLGGALLVTAVTGCELKGKTAGDASDTPTAAATSTPAPATKQQLPSPTPSQRNKPKPHPTPARGTALVALATLPTKGRAPMSDYDRDQFGQAWLDTDRNGCDTRNDILARDLRIKHFRSGTGGCVVEAGALADPYTGATVDFIRGPGDIVDVDHVVALGNAWVTGANRWDIRKRAALANDPMNLLAVDASVNRQKGNSDAATWLPANRVFRCAYVARQVAVKKKYGLWVTAPERAAIARILSTCPNQPLPADSVAPVSSPLAPNAPRRQPLPTSSGQSSGQGNVWYENCDAARAAGAAPVHRGDPGYDSHLDRDQDGVGCDS
jgi:hypothetical protein